jgi:hypothetical protein
MTYTVIYKDHWGHLDTLTFASDSHDKNHACTEFAEKYAEEGQVMIGIIPGCQLVYFSSDVSSTKSP